MARIDDPSRLLDEPTNVHHILGTIHHGKGERQHAHLPDAFVHLARTIGNGRKLSHGELQDLPFFFLDLNLRADEREVSLRRHCLNGEWGISGSPWRGSQAGQW